MSIPQCKNLQACFGKNEAPTPGCAEFQGALMRLILTPTCNRACHQSTEVKQRVAANEFLGGSFSLNGKSVQLSGQGETPPIACFGLATLGKD